MIDEPRLPTSTPRPESPVQRPQGPDARHQYPDTAAQIGIDVAHEIVDLVARQSRGRLLLVLGHVRGVQRHIELPERKPRQPVRDIEIDTLHVDPAKIDRGQTDFTDLARTVCISAITLDQRAKLVDAIETRGQNRFPRHAGDFVVKVDTPQIRAGGKTGDEPGRPYDA